MKKISVIVPIYNKEKYIDRCLESITNQTYSELEILLIDDGSTDESSFICKKWEQLDERVKYYYKKNGGVAEARNYGLDNSHGELISFVDPDDYLKLDCFKILVSELVNENADISYCHALDLCEGENIIYTNSNETGIISRINQTNYNWIDNKAHFVCWAAVYKKRILNDIRFDDDLVVGEDTVFFAKCILKAKRVISIDKAEYCYYINSQSVVNNYEWKNVESELIAWRRVCEISAEYSNLSKSAKAAYAIRCKKNAIKYYRYESEKERYLKREYCKNVVYLLLELIKKRQFADLFKSLFALLFWKKYLELKQPKEG